LEQRGEKMNIDAVVWDFDGTLVDSMERNRRITHQVLKKMKIDVPDSICTLEGFKRLNYRYKNWKELYKFGYNMNDEEVIEAGKLWTPFQAAEKTDLLFYPGIRDIIVQFRNKYQGICSQNSKKNIENTLEKEGVSDIIKTVIGYEEVIHSKQKPQPDSLLLCLNSFFNTVDGKTIVYIGDHEEDAILVDNTVRYLNEINIKSNILSIIISHDNADTNKLYANPNFRVQSVEELKKTLIQIDI
jgi:beta-phosphoglucomutase-like phosphatase (HAD superfamily)